MSLILGMDTIVFLAWIGTILSTILCVVYGIYYQFFKKSSEEISQKKDEDSQKKEAD